VNDRRIVRFVYRDRQRAVLAYGLVHRFGRWYLVGPEQGDDVVKAFRLDRMGQTEVGDGEAAFERPSGFEAAAVLAELGPERTDGVAHIRFDQDVVAVALHRSPAARVLAEDETTALIEVPLVETGSMISWLLTFDDRAVVEGPDELRSAFIEFVRGRS
jgi:predicted DNA-binding transcriptional regulator YafY